LFLLIWALLLAPFIVPLSPSLAEWEHFYPLRVQLYRDLVGAVTMLVATWVMTRFVDRRPLATIGFDYHRFLRDFLPGFAVGSGWLAVSLGSVWAAGWLAPQPNVVVAWSNLPATAVSVFLNVLTQQLLLCGYVFQTIQARTNPVVAVLISALLFSAYHAGAFQGSWLAPLNVFLAGLLFCLAYRSTGNLWFPIAIHFAWNYFLGPVMGLTVSGSNHLGSGVQVFILKGPALFSGGTFGLEGGLIITLTTVIIIMAMLLVIHRQAKEMLLLKQISVAGS